MLHYRPESALSTSTTPETSGNQTREVAVTTRQEIGKQAYMLDGFSLLGEYESPHADVRETLEARVVEQPAAIDAIIDALDRGIVRTNTRPLATLAFLGPTGVGKTETAKALAAAMADKYSDGGSLIKIDCGEFSLGHAITSLVGAPPSYVGREQTPLLHPKMVRGHSVILFDEIEKGSPELNDLLLQIMEEGELAMHNSNAVASFEDSIIIMTSNLGAAEMSKHLRSAPLGFSTPAAADSKGSGHVETAAREGFRQHFRPEFFNRIDKLAVFNPLTTVGLGRVLSVKLAQANDVYRTTFGFGLDLSDGARHHLVTLAAQEPDMGGRPLIRAFQDYVQSELGGHVGAENIPNGTLVKIFHRDEFDAVARDTLPELVFMSKHDDAFRIPARHAIDDETESDTPSARSTVVAMRAEDD